MFLKCLRKGFNEIGMKTKLFKFFPLYKSVCIFYIFRNRLLGTARYATTKANIFYTSKL